MNLLFQQFKVILPLASKWVEEQERIILQEGEPLSAQGLEDARLMGVTYPEQIRLLQVESIPLPSNPILKAAAVSTGLISQNTGGMSLRYGIFLRTDCWENREIIAHECVHTAQYERFGSVKSFLQHYLEECITIGYPDAPLEQEAITKAAEINF